MCLGEMAAEKMPEEWRSVPIIKNKADVQRDKPDERKLLGKSC